MFLKCLKRSFFVIEVIFAAIVLAAAWFVSTNSGLNTLLNLMEKAELDTPLNVYFDEARGSLLHGFTISGITVTSGDSVPEAGRRSFTGSASGEAAEKLLEAGSLTFGYSFSLRGESLFVPEQVIIEGAVSDFESLSSLMDYAASFGGGGAGGGVKPILLDFALKSGDFSVPNMEPVKISEISLSKNGGLKLDVNVGNVNISADQEIPIEHYLEMRVDSIALNVGSGRADLGFALSPSVTISADFSGLSIADLLDICKVSFDADGYAAGNAQVRFLDQGLAASGHLKLEELKISGAPISSFSSPWSFNDNDMVLKFPQIGATIRGMENLKGWASIDTLNTSGAFTLSGEKLSLSDLQRTFRLNYPVEGENGSFHAKMEFSPGGISGDIGVKIPSVKIEDHKIDDLDLNVSLKDGAAEGNFKANLFGAPVNGSGHISFASPYAISLNSEISGLESSNLAFFVPAMAAARPQGKITADIKLNGTLDSIQADGVVKSDKFSLYGLDFRNLSVSLNSEAGSNQVNYKITSSGGMALNTSGQINPLEQKINGKGSLTLDAGSIPDLGSNVKGKINSNFEISGSFSNPVVSVSASGKDNSFFDMPVTQSSVSAKYSSGTLEIADSSFQFDPNSFIWVKGKISFLAAEPKIDVYGTAKNFSLSPYGLDTKVSGQFKASGAASNPQITGEFATPEEGLKETSDRLNVKITGSAKSMAFEITDSKIAGGTLNGKGRLEPSERRLPWVDFELSAVNVRLREFFKTYNIESAVGGIFTGNIRIRRTGGNLTAVIRSRFPLTFNQLMFDRFFVRLSFIRRGEFNVNVGALIGDALNLRVSGKLLRERERWKFNFSTNNINMDRLMQVMNPDLRGSIEGSFRITGDMELSPGGNKGYTLEAPDLDMFGFRISDLRVPFEYEGDEIKFKVDRGDLGGASIIGEGRADLIRSKWDVLLSMKDISLEKLVEHILSPRGGKLTGKGDARLRLNGNFGVMSNFLGFGYFTASSGSLEGLEGMESINSEKKLEFESVDCGFVFNGKDVIVTTRTSINAHPGDNHYRYIKFSGPLGISGKGMNLSFTARINLDVLNILISSFEGLINLAAGGNALLNPVKAVVGRALGLNVNDFSNVKFNLRGGWGDPILSDLKLDRQMTGVHEWGKNDNNHNSERRFDLKVDIPIGPGSSELSFEDVLKKAILDGLFDSLVPELHW